MQSITLSTLTRTAAVAALGLASVAAQAAPTLTVNGWMFATATGSDRNVVTTRTLPAPAKAYSGAAGAFSGTLVGYGNPFEVSNVDLYCVDLDQTIGVPGGPYTDFTIVTDVRFSNSADKSATIWCSVDRTRAVTQWDGKGRLNAGSVRDDRWHASDVGIFHHSLGSRDGPRDLGRLSSVANRRGQ